MKAFPMMFLFVISLSFHLAGSPAAAAENSPVGTTAKSPSTGDIDMNQFKNLDPSQEREKRKDSRIKIDMTCTDPQGHLIKKGEVGFETCMSQKQTPLINQSRTPETPNDPRSR
jgi:hypothetical protein